MNEEVVRGNLSEIQADFAARERILGELVLVIGGSGKESEQANCSDDGGEVAEISADD